MTTVSHTLLALAVCASAAAFVSQASAQVDTQKAPPGPPNTISAHRMAALKKCTDGKKIRRRQIRRVHDSRGRGSVGLPSSIPSQSGSFGS